MHGPEIAPAYLIMRQRFEAQEDGIGRRPWMGRVALGFVLVTLVTLVLVPLIVQQRVARLRDEIEVAEPASTLVNQLQYQLIREMGALSEAVLKGEVGPPGTYGVARAAEDTLHRRIEPIVAELGGNVLRRYTIARTLADQWHRRTADPEVFRGLEEGATLMDVPRERRLFDDLITATNVTDEAIMRHIADVRSEIVALERTSLQLTVLLGFLALLAAGVVAALEERGRRMELTAARRREIAERALGESARANEARARLIRGITHDVKNPLGAAKGYAELLALGIRGPASPAQLSLIEGVQRSVDSALEIITDLLDVARADSGGLTVNRVEVDFCKVVREATEGHMGAVEAAGHELVMQVRPEPLTIHTDPARARQVLDNLLSNAVKYTPSPGKITVEVDQVDGPGAPRAGRWAVVRVIDDGPGIPEEMREAVFDEFTRFAENGHLKGHGLGLAIARRIARILGGELTVEPHDGAGAVFAFWLPVREPPQSPA